MISKSALKEIILLYDNFRRNADSALYLDFEDDRLAGFTVEDFPSVREAFLEIRPAEVQSYISSMKFSTWRAGNDSAGGSRSERTPPFM